MPRIDWELLEEEYDDLDEATHRRRHGRDRSVKAEQRIAGADLGRVVAVARGSLEVFHDDERQAALFGGSMRGTKVVVGDRVGIRAPRHTTDTARVVSLEHRSTFLTRTPDDADDTERLVVANADQVAVVVSGDHLEAAGGFIDRVLVAASVGGLEPLVVVNKLDLAAPEPVAALVGLYEAIGIRAVSTSAVTGQGLDDLREAIAGMWSAFTGHSGVGKSSLFNHLVPAADQAVADIGRHGGRHTTVAAVASHVPSLDAWLVDTPGVRSFGLGTVTPATLADHFPELADLQCELPACEHVGQPGCDIASATIDNRRLQSYLRLREAVV